MIKRGKQYWLMKSEPSVFSLKDLKDRPRSTDHWDGARNYIRAMKKGDLVLFYHSNCETPGVVGFAEVVREGYPDHTAFDPLSPYYDPNSLRENPRWFMVDVQWKEDFRRTVSLCEMRNTPALKGMQVLKKGQRLSVMPVTREELKKVCVLGRALEARLKLHAA